MKKKSTKKAGKSQRIFVDIYYLKSFAIFQINITIFQQ